MLDEYVNSSGKSAESDDEDLEDITNSGATQEEVTDAASQLGMTAEQAQSLQEAIDELEEQKMKLSEQLAEKIEEALNDSMMADKVDVEFTSDYVLLTLNGAFLFDSGKADIKNDAIPVLNKIGVILAKYADSDIEIEGHTDSVPLNGGRYENNDVLSSYRALAVFDYLKDNAAIDPGVMKHSGRGEYVPIADNSTPEGRAKNRRVEIKIFNSLSGY
jgi:chemotaxis protein MotB